MKKVGLPASMFPLLTSIAILLLIVICYTIAISLGHVLPIWPYISDLGVHYPESCVSALLSAFAAATGFPMAFIRYKEILYYEEMEVPERRYIKILNQINLYFMILSLIGVIFNGTFQQFGVDRLHSIGGGFLFVFGAFSIVVDSFITFKMSEKARSTLMRNFRVILSCLVPPFALMSFIGKYASEAELSAKFPKQTLEEKMQRLLNWDSSLPGYDVHLMGSVNELLVLITYVSYITSLAIEFKQFNIDLKLIFKNKT